MWQPVAFVLPQPTSLQFEFWKDAAELVIIPLLVYTFHKFFIGRGEANNATIENLVKTAKANTDSITNLQNDATLLKWRVDTEVTDRQRLQDKFDLLKQDVDRTAITSTNDRNDRNAGRRERG